MKKEKEIDQFVEGLEMTILSAEDQVLLSSLGGDEVSGINNQCTFNNCHGSNCISGCGG